MKKSIVETGIKIFAKKSIIYEETKVLISDIEMEKTIEIYDQD